MGTVTLPTVYPKKYAHGFCFAVLCCGYTLTDFPISIRLTSLALWQSNDCPSASKATLTNMYKYFMWIHYERLHNHNKAKHNKTVCIILGIYCKLQTLFDQCIAFSVYFVSSLRKTHRELSRVLCTSCSVGWGDRVGGTLLDLSLLFDAALPLSRGNRCVLWGPFQYLIRSFS